MEVSLGQSNIPAFGHEFFSIFIMGFGCWAKLGAHKGPEAIPEEVKTQAGWRKRQINIPSDCPAMLALSPNYLSLGRLVRSVQRYS